MLRWRLVSAAVIIGLLLVLTTLDYRRALGAPPGGWLAPFLLLVTFLGTRELLGLFAAKGHYPARWSVFLGLACVSIATVIPIYGSQFAKVAMFSDRSFPWMLLALAAAVSVVSYAEMRRFQGPSDHIVNAALGLFAIVYVGVLFGVLVPLRLFRDNETGMIALVSMLVVVKCSDAGAYLFGRLLGSTKLTPNLSPKKTVEGAIGGLAMAAVASLLFFRFIAPQIATETYVVPSVFARMGYGFGLGIVAIVGDLVESMIKREMEIKDSSTLLPGLGGVLDVIDSVLLGGPAALLCWQIGLLDG